MAESRFAVQQVRDDGEAPLCCHPGPIVRLCVCVCSPDNGLCKFAGNPAHIFLGLCVWITFRATKHTPEHQSGWSSSTTIERMSALCVFWSVRSFRSDMQCTPFCLWMRELVRKCECPLARASLCEYGIGEREGMSWRQRRNVAYTTTHTDPSIPISKYPKIHSLWLTIDLPLTDWIRRCRRGRVVQVVVFDVDDAVRRHLSDSPIDFFLCECVCVSRCPGCCYRTTLRPTAGAKKTRMFYALSIKLCKCRSATLGA